MTRTNTKDRKGRRLKVFVWIGAFFALKSRLPGGVFNHTFGLIGLSPFGGHIYMYQHFIVFHCL